MKTIYDSAEAFIKFIEDGNVLTNPSSCGGGMEVIDEGRKLFKQKFYQWFPQEEYKRKQGEKSSFIINSFREVVFEVVPELKEVPKINEELKKIKDVFSDEA